ncbi:MAG: hypothetical protein JWM95_232 [Gemmatimonadetes bacterium]|nr:hypothetical protein [Gemmatimonadota bacterium]
MSRVADSRVPRHFDLQPIHEGAADASSYPIPGYLLIKLASRCNLACTYCYWFRDGTVYETPSVMQVDVEYALVERLAEHIACHKLSSFNCIFHGGEPLLFPLRRFERLVQLLAEIGQARGCKMEFSITTNGTLVTPEWARAFQKHGVEVAVSIDGTEAMHDRARLTRRGLGSHADAVRGYRTLCDHGITPSVIAVCDPTSDPIDLLEFMTDSLGCTRFDVLPPDLNNDDTIVSIAGYYIHLFDAWYDRYLGRGVRIRYLYSLMRGVLGLDTNSDSMGYGPLHTISLGTNGSLEPNDVLRIGGAARTTTSANVRSNAIVDVCREPTWQEAYSSALKLASACESCRHRSACGGGHLSHRWSDARGYENPSAYCADLQQILDHVWDRVASDVFLNHEGATMSLKDARALGIA